MSKHLTGILSIAVVAVFITTARAQTSYPMLMSLDPVAVQIGQTSEHQLSARYDLGGTFAVLVSGEGVSGEAIPPEVKEGEKPPPGDKLTLRFTVADDATPGVRDFRVVTPRGASTVGQLVVVQDPVVSESGDNNSPGGAQQIELPATVCGAIEKNEDIDYFQFHAEAGTALVFHVQGQRLENKIHDLQNHLDPILTLRTAAGATLAAVDNYYAGDPLLYWQFDQAGDYLLEIRDVRYQGNANWHYAIEIHNRPFVTHVFPPRVSPDVATPLELVGFSLPSEAVTKAQLPFDPRGLVRQTSLTVGEHQTGAVPIIVDDLPEVIEEPRAAGAETEPQTIPAPSGTSGRISEPAEIDSYVFEAKKDERFTLETIARRCESQLDPLVRITDAEGKVLAENDDLSTGRHTFADSLIENWTAPADGRYRVEIRDLHLRGGPGFVYYLRLTRSEPYFTLDIDTDKTLLEPGTSAAIFVRAFRKNGLEGEIALAVDGLPAGVTAQCGRILAAARDGVIILTAAPDAEPAAANIEITGRLTQTAEDGATTELVAHAEPLQEIYMPGGGRNHWPVAMHTVSVGSTGDLLAVKAEPASITLAPGGSQRIDVTIDRREGFDKNVTLDCLFQHLGSIYGDTLPPGVTIDNQASKLLLTGNESQGHITLKATADAKPVAEQQVPVMANISINFVMKHTYSAAPLLVTVAEPAAEASE